MTCKSPLTLCPLCGTLLPVAAQLGGPEPLYCLDHAHWTSAGYDVQTLRHEIKRWAYDYFEPLYQAVKDWQPPAGSLQQTDPGEQKTDAFIAQLHVLYKE